MSSTGHGRCGEHSDGVVGRAKTPQADATEEVSGAWGRGLYGGNDSTYAAPTGEWSEPESIGQRRAAACPPP